MRVLTLLLVLVGSFFCTSCTISIMLTDSHGTDNDVESTPTQETSTDADFSMPAV